MTHSRTPWSLSPRSHDGPTVVLDASGVAVASFNDPRDADFVVAASKMMSPAEVDELIAERNEAREDRDDAQKAATANAYRLDCVRAILEASDGARMVLQGGDHVEA